MFSIIVPVYNVEKYIAECIESVLNQNFGDYELILVDNGSTDKGLQICKEYAQRNADKIKLFHKENEGLLLTRRYGLKMSNGEYVVFLDSDDCLRNNALEELNRVIKSMMLYSLTARARQIFQYRLCCMKRQAVSGRVSIQEGCFAAPIV